MSTSIRSDAGRGARNQSIEVVRIVAAYGIVAYHSAAPFHDLAYSGLIVFLILSPYVDCRYNWTRTRSIGALATVFLVPWLFWFVFYGASSLAVHKPFLPPGPIWAGVAYGTSPHLWFLPAMFFVLVGLNAVKTRIAPAVLFRVCVVGTVGLLASVAIWRPISIAWMPPLAQWVHAAPAVLLGIALGTADKVSPTNAIVGRIALIAATLVAVVAGLPGIGIPYGVGLAVTLAATRFDLGLPLGRFDVRPIAACMLGVYLSHIAFLKVFEHLSGAGSYVTVTLAFVTATAVVWAAQRLVPVSRWVIGRAG